MTVSKIAAGVLLGNIVSGLLCWAVFSFVIDGVKSKMEAAQSSIELNAVRAQYPEAAKAEDEAEASNAH